MITVNEQALREKLIKEGHSNCRVNILVKKVTEINEQLNTVLNAWLEDGSILDFEVEGVTIETIMEKAETNFYNALFLMSIFIERPESARLFLEKPDAFRC